jgi:plastocyanin
MPRTQRTVPRRFPTAAALAVLIPLSIGPALPVTPGVDIAAPRVAVSTVDGASLLFHPARLVIEQSDFVRWNWSGGMHTTTSGASCLADGLWTSPLNSTSTNFSRAFLDDDPGTYPYFCSPHCGFGMTGQVVVTLPIPLTVTASGQAIQLDWTGVVGQFRVFRSTSPLFTGLTTAALTPANGTAATTLLDQTAGTPPVGSALYYLVVNWFAP